MIGQRRLSLAPLFLISVVAGAESHAQTHKPEIIFTVPSKTDPVWKEEKLPSLSLRLPSNSLRDKERLQELENRFADQKVDNRFQVTEGVHAAVRPNRLRVTIPFGAPRN